MRFPVSLLENIQEALRTIEDAATGYMDPKVIHIEAEVSADNGTYLVTLDRTGFGDWDIDVTEKVEEPKSEPKKRAPRKATR